VRKHAPKGRHGLPRLRHPCRHERRDAVGRPPAHHAGGGQAKARGCLRGDGGGGGPGRDDAWGQQARKILQQGRA